MEEKGKEFGLKVSEKKTKYMTTALSDGRPLNHMLELNGKRFEASTALFTLGRR